MSDSKNKTQQWTTVITSKKKVFHMGLKELFSYKDLIFLFFKRDFTALYKQTILGPAWYLIQPLFTTVVYGFVFGKLAGIGTEGIPSYLFYMAGIILWRFFTDTLKKNSNTFLSNKKLFGKVYFPRLTVPLSTLMSNLMTLVIQISLFLIFYIYFLLKGMPITIHWSLVFFPLLIIQISLLGMGIGLLITSLTTKYRDLKFLITFGLQLWMYGSPIAYPLSEIMTRIESPIVKWLFIINPIAFPVELFRFMVFQGNQLDWIQGAISIGLTVVFFIWGVATFNRVQQDFMDRI